MSLNVDMEFVDPDPSLMGCNSLNLNNAFTDPTSCREVASELRQRYMAHMRATARFPDSFRSCRGVSRS